MAGFMQQLVAAGRDIKLAHSIFALPFALVGAFYAASGLPRWGEVGLVVAAMFFARTFAMLANRYFDRDIDAANPRTAGRALPAGRLNATLARAMMAGSVALFILTAAGFWLVYENVWPMALSPVVLAWLGLYSLTKRFTLACHFVLGGALAISPLAAGLAIEPAALREPTLWLLAGFVLLWVAGFDIIYACQDIDFDRERGLASIPAALGERGALVAAKVAHFTGLFSLVAMYRLDWTFRYAEHQLTLWAIVGVGVLLMVEHRAASARRFSLAFFTVNGIVAVLFAAAAIADILMT